MNGIKNRRKQTLRMVQMAILLALVVVFQLIGGFIHIGPTSISLVLLPIAIGAMLLGAYHAATLGFVFGLVVFIQGVMGVDMFTHILFTQHPIITFFTCTVKSTVAGYIGGLLYKLIEKRQRYAATFVCAAVIPIVNTGLFILGALFMSDTLSSNFVAEGQSVIYFLVIICAGVNFIAEFLLNLIVAPALHTVYKAVKN